ncbi:LysE family translocator [Rhodobacteraceae bacterium CCMM004]|nr:LysE family translocator [Rhodobacteraceae bacterium CCMM004]
MLDPAGLFAAWAAFVVAAASPGPATLAVAAVSMRSGRGAGLRFGTGLGLGLAAWGLVAATGVGVVLEASEAALSVLKLAGGAYLLWLAWGAARSAVRTADATEPVSDDARWLRRGAILNLSNPKAVFAWMATLSLGVGAGAEPVQVATATALCAVTGGAIYAGYAVAFSAPGARAAYARARRGIEAAVAGLFALAGLGLIRSALAR